MTKDEAIHLLRNTAWLAPSGTLESVEEAVEMAIDALKENITHCKDCEYYQTPEKYSYKEPNPYCCRSALTKVSENDFCSKAIRKDGERI